MLELPSKIERDSAEVMRELAKGQAGFSVTMQDLDEMLIGINQSAALPYLTIKKYRQNPKEAVSTSKIIGTAVFKKDKMVGMISERVTRGVLWLRNELKEYTVTIKPHHTKGDVSIGQMTSDVKLIPKITNGKWQMTVKVITEGTILQNTTNLDFANPKFTKIAEKAFQEAIKNRINLALGQLQHKYKVDIAGFADAYYQKYPKEFNKVQNRWNEVFQQVDINIAVEAHIQRQGSILTPGGMPEKEVKEK